MSTPIKWIAMTPGGFASLCGQVAEQMIEHHKMDPDCLKRLSEIGQGIILQMMSNHDLNFAEGIIVLCIMLESMFILDKQNEPMMTPPCPVSKDHIN